MKIRSTGRKQLARANPQTSLRTPAKKFPSNLFGIQRATQYYFYEISQDKREAQKEGKTFQFFKVAGDCSSMTLISAFNFLLFIFSKTFHFVDGASGSHKNFHIIATSLTEAKSCDALKRWKTLIKTFPFQIFLFSLQKSLFLSLAKICSGFAR